MAERCEVGGVAAGAAGGVERDTDRQAGQDLVDDRLFPVDHRVARLVV